MSKSFTYLSLLNQIVHLIVTIAPMQTVQKSQSDLLNVNFDNLEFGKVFTDHMMVSDYNGEEWSDFKIQPLQSLSMHPATSVLHYGQAIFEGLKAYKNETNGVNIFRLKDNIKRMNASAHRMMMPQLDEGKTKEAIMRYVAGQKAWIPNRSQGSLYVRPLMISTDRTLRALASQTYRFIVIACPVGFYYNTPLSIFLEKGHSRASKGGVGYAKAAGNYAASFYPSVIAKNLGFDQVLWTDITNDFALEELGSANFFYVKNGNIHTPKMQDSILRGITRDTVINLAKDAGINVTSELITADAFEKDLAAGEVECMFATGTAAAITYVNSITIGENKYEVSSNQYDPVLRLKEQLDAAKFLDSDKHPEWNIIV